VLLLIGADEAGHPVGELEGQRFDLELSRAHELEEPELVLGARLDEDAVQEERVEVGVEAQSRRCFQSSDLLESAC
jgi:hypothetical protein